MTAPAFALANPPQADRRRSQGSQARIETLRPIDPLRPNEPRVRVWLPAGYDETVRAHRVLYLLDGQFAFAGDSGSQNFAADRRVARLVVDGTIPPTLVVAIDNLDEYRFLQYMPQSIYRQAPPGVRAVVEAEVARTGGRPLVSAEFITWVATRLKPHVDARYRTSPTRLDTAVFGASMAGLMSAALFVEASGAFGRAACMSPNWAIYDKNMIDHPSLPGLWASYFARLGAPAGRRLWLDHGTEMMDAGMRPHQAAIAERLSRLGWTPGCNLQRRVYQAGHAYAETAVQMDEVLAWLLA